MQGFDAADPACADRPAEPSVTTLRQGASGLRIAVAGGYFQRGAFPEAIEALQRGGQGAQRDRGRRPA